MRQGDLKDIGGLAEFTASYQQHGRQPFVPPPNLLGPPNVPNFSTWSAPQAAPAPYGYSSYPYPMYPNQAPLQPWQQFSPVPDMKAAMHMQPQAMPSLTATTSDASQVSAMTAKREDSHIASFIQAQQTFLQRAATLSSLNASSSIATSPSRPAPGNSKSSSQYSLSAATMAGDRLAMDQRRPAVSTSTMNNIPQQAMGGADSAALSDDLLMRVVKGDGNAIDLMSRSCNNIRQQPPAASHTGNAWSKPGISSGPQRNTAGTRFRSTHQPPSKPSQPSPSTTPPSLATVAQLDAQLAGLHCPPDQMKQYLGNRQFHQTRMLMLNQQEQFIQQLYDLHRIVSVQKLLTAELQSPEHATTMLHQTVCQQKDKLEKQLRRDLHLLHNIPSTLRNPWIKNSPNPPDVQQFHISKDSKEGRTLPCPAPQHPNPRSSPASKPNPPPTWATPSQTHTHSHATAALPSASTATEASLPQPTTSQTPHNLPKPTLIRPVPTALQPPPPYQSVDIHSMWVAKHGGTSNLKGSGPQSSANPPSLSLPSQLTGQQITGLSSECIASFGLGLSSLSAGGSLAGGSLVHSSNKDGQSKTRVRYWWQDEAAAFGGVGMPDEIPSSRQTGSVALSKDDYRARSGDPQGPLKKRAKYKEGVSTLDMVQESAGGGSVIDRPTSSKAAAAVDQPAAKEATGARSKPDGAASKHKRKRQVAQPQDSGSGGSENSVPTVTLERQATKDSRAAGTKSVSAAAAAAAKPRADEDDEVTNDPAAGHTARSAANILLSISSSFRPA